MFFLFFTLGIHAATVSWFADYVFSVNTTKGLHDINAAVFQDDLWRYYENDWPPPIETTFLILSIHTELQQEITQDCPLLIAMAYMFSAELLIYTQPDDAMQHYQIARTIVEGLPDPTDVPTWPLFEAAERFQKEAQKLEDRRKEREAHFVREEKNRGLPTVDVVIAYCTESLAWRSELLPDTWNVYIYYKCGHEPSDALPKDTKVCLDNHGMESYAYAEHIVRTPASKRSDFTLFMQADYEPHLNMHLFHSVLQSLQLGTYDVPFLHLNSRRFLATENTCMKEIAQLLNMTTTRFGSYCCNQFVVRRDRFMPAETYRQLSAYFQNKNPTMCVQNNAHDDRPGIAKSALCEHMWHVLFSEPDVLPFRSRDTRLPSFLRVDDFSTPKRTRGDKDRETY